MNGYGGRKQMTDINAQADAHGFDTAITAALQDFQRTQGVIGLAIGHHHQYLAWFPAT